MATFEKGKAFNQVEFELDRIKAIEAKQKLDASEHFNKLHEQGANRFGLLWLTCNMTVATARNLPFLPTDDRRIDAVLSQAAWNLAENIENNKPTLTDQESATVESLRVASDNYAPFTKDEVMSLIAIIDRFTGNSEA